MWELLLRLCWETSLWSSGYDSGASNAGGVGSIPGQETKIQHAVQLAKKKKKKRERERDSVS